MTPADLYDAFRSDVVDTVKPYLWTDSDVWRYLNDAQKMFCRLTGGLGDATNPDATQLDYGVGTIWVDTHPAILKIRGAYRVSDGRPIEIINYEDLAKLGIRIDGRTGVVRRLIIGMEPNKAMLLCTPEIADTIQLLIDRLPLNDLDGDSKCLEVADQHHEHLLLWAKHLAYAKQDAETFDKSKSAEFEFNFRQYCAAAKSERERATHKTRVVTYGGI